MIAGIEEGKLQPILVAKNGRAREYIDKTLDLSGMEVQEMRAEDIPGLVDKQLPQWLGLTTTELVVNYLMVAKQPQLEVLQTINWNDDGCLYGKPTICAIGKKDIPKALVQGVRERDIIIATNETSAILSAALGSGYLNRQNISFKTLRGETEAALKLGYADMVVEIVGTGSTVERYGLQIYAPLFLIDFALIGNKRYISQLRGK